MNSNPYILLDENLLANYLIPIPSLFYGFSIKILSCTHIIPMPQLQAKSLMTSQSWLCIEYLIPTYSTLVLFTHIFDKNVHYLTSLNMLPFVKSILFFGIYVIINVKKTTVIHMLTATGLRTSKTAKIKRCITISLHIVVHQCAALQ